MARRFPPRTRPEWAQIASGRILSVLRKHRLCNVRQLESKIAEAGPPSIRAQPLSIKDGLDYLLERGAVVVGLPKNSAPGITVNFYAPADFSLDRYNDKGRLNFLLEHWPIYREATGTKELCGDVLEKLVDSALTQCPELIRVGEPGRDFHNFWLDGRQFDNSPPADHVVYYRTQGLVLGIEDKNWRQWIYPKDAIISRMLEKSLQNQHVPILITRKLPYLTRLLLQQVGALGFEMHFMYVHPSLEAKFELIRHKDGMGFADLRFSLDPPKHLVHFLESEIPKQIESVAETFEGNRDLVQAFVDEEISYYEFMTRLGIFPEIEPDDELEMMDYYEPF